MRRYHRITGPRTAAACGVRLLGASLRAQDEARAALAYGSFHERPWHILGGHAYRVVRVLLVPFVDILDDGESCPRLPTSAEKKLTMRG